MSKKTLAELKANFKPKEQTQNQNTERMPSNYYRFWDMKPGERCVIRFLPDTNDSNPHGFLVEKKYHSLHINGEKKSIPCPKTQSTSNACAICDLSRDYYKVNDKVNGKKYYRKLQHIAQVLVVEDPLAPDAATNENSAGKLKYITLGYQIYNIIKEAFANDDEPLEGVPYDSEEGYDFIIKKTQAPGADHPGYTVGTKFMSRQRSLNDDELTIVNEHSIDLSTLLPKNLGSEVVASMLEAHLNGVSFEESDEDNSEPSEDAPKKAPAAAPAKQSAPSSAEDDDVDEMLAVIAARRKQQQ